ncbi:threonine ammonia-lyase IlvA [Chitinophaga oryziterrae]|uniref:L-threonine dehydratase n=1 Tax=Chitinophaga oryziterrae TaxID=1031224 RepID=A0A6N8J6T8_9BACT|nr:threonine ammonia-lyase IlvA [Chitinophaga oryziterrae]MVT40957.1 threonine ammonia-lyase IlvA [Chitinophaga oryziterrae]
MSQVITSVNPLNILDAAVKLKPVVNRTPLSYSATLSRRYNADIYLKREDMQIVRSYKLRGAYNMISSLDKEILAKGVTCASAGNHAQGFAYACRQMDIQGVVFMPIVTPRQKVTQVTMFGGDNIQIKLVGDTFDDCSAEAQAFTKLHGMTFIPPFDDAKIIEGQGTVAVEILEDQAQIDYLFVPVGGGGLAAGVGTYFKTYSPRTKIIGVEPEGAPSMLRALENGGPVTLTEIERFVDGAAVKRVGNLTYEICKDVLSKMHLVPEGRVCSTILRLYNEDAIVVEPAGALSMAALEDFAKEIEGKTVVCVLSGSNNDIDRMQEIKERSLLYEGLKHYFIIRFIQRPGALKEFVNDVLGPTDDITRFEFIQKHNKEMGPALIGVELKNREDYDILIANFNKYNIHYTELNKDDDLFGYLV